MRDTKPITRKLLQVIMLAGILAVSGCTTRLAPNYDEALFEAITDTSVSIMQLFALVTPGTDSATCSQREPAYNTLIGTVDALVIQSRARPMPDSAVLERVNEHLDSRGAGIVTGDTAPSTSALENISEQLVRMKQVDCESGLTPNVIAIFRNAVMISLDQAITYESFLER